MIIWWWSYDHHILILWNVQKMPQCPATSGAPEIFELCDFKWHSGCHGGWGTAPAGDERSNSQEQLSIGTPWNPKTRKPCCPTRSGETLLLSTSLSDSCFLEAGNQCCHDSMHSQQYSVGDAPAPGCHPWGSSLGVIRWVSNGYTQHTIKSMDYV